MNRKKIMNHLRSNKDIRKTKRTGSRTHRSDRKTGSITDHDGRRIRGVRRSDRRKDTRIRSSVVRGTRVGDPLDADGWRQPHSVEGLCQGSLIPLATTSWAEEVESRSARRRQHSLPCPPGGAGDEAPLPDLGGATWRYALTTGGRRSARAHLQEEEREGDWSLGGRPTTPTTTSSAPPTPLLGPGGGAPRRGGGWWWGSDECARGRG
jgi:hypothetical protein